MFQAGKALKAGKSKPAVLSKDSTALSRTALR